MDFTPHRPTRRAAESVVPMINVVFLLLIFFLMTAQIAPPVPFDVTPPASASDSAADGPVTLHISGDGVLYLDGATGDAVWPVLSALPPDARLLIRADAGFRAADLAQHLARLTAMGLSDIALVTEASQ